MASGPRSPRHYVGNFDLEEKPKAATPPPVEGGERTETADPALRAQRLQRLEAQKRELPAMMYLEAKAIITGGISRFSMEPSEAQRKILHKIGMPGY